ncbi:hypothetical protein HHI36_004463 [Cryptolaemus montrouzieri]|uniref:EF-hand domain-containing family member B n=1 Tax=Cryptolaemus montrouzieri TaxID=559131 RepID=A0ABD2NRF8_9CUCU
MANAGKFIDRCPVICAAGKSNSPNTTVRETLLEYPIPDQVEAIKHDLKIFNEKTSNVPDKLSRIENVRHRGQHDRVLNHLMCPKKTRYQQLITDLKETTYSSYWTHPLGKTPDSMSGLPKGIDAMNTTFGHKPPEHISLYEIALPKISPHQVLWDSQINHDKYKKIYNDYNIGEKIDRNYYKPPYNPNNCAGHKTKYDERGLGVACAMKWFNPEPISVSSKKQADYWDIHHSKTGESYTPIQVHNIVPKNHTFGKMTPRPMHGMAELLRPGCPPALYKRETLERMASLNMLRQNIKKRFSPTFCLTDLFNKLAYYDQEMTNFIPIKHFYEVMSCLNIRLNRENLEALFENLGIIQTGKIDYRRFVDALAFDMEFEDQLDALPFDKLFYCSESTAANLDRCFTKDNDKPAAGLSSHRYDLKVPPRRGCESERDNLPTDDVKALLDRSIFIHYNISYRDMFKVNIHVQTRIHRCPQLLLFWRFHSLLEEIAKNYLRGLGVNF